MRKDSVGEHSAPRILAIASPGGHILELNELVRNLPPQTLDLLTYEERFSNESKNFRLVHRVANGLLTPSRFRAHRLLQHMGRLTGECWKLLDALRPDIIVSTGSEIAIPAYIWARSRAKRALYVESVCRLTSMSATGRVALATGASVWVQWPELASLYPRARYAGDVFPPAVAARPPTSGDVFVTSGTAAFPRLIGIADEIAAGGRRVLVQRGRTETRPQIATSFDFVADFSQIEQYCREAGVVVSHAGAGSVMTALRMNCRLVVVPRRRHLNEHTDDHQMELARALERRGLARIAHSPADAKEAVEELLENLPSRAKIDEKPNPTELLESWIRGGIE